ncbi:AN1-type zinc finger protein 6, partial [Galemys pyrenaicus]
GPPVGLRDAPAHGPLTVASAGARQRNMAQEANRSQAPMLCSTGCGFYGNPRTNGMCSVCYKEHLQRQNSSGRVSPPVHRRRGHGGSACAGLHVAIRAVQVGPWCSPGRALLAVAPAPHASSSTLTSGCFCSPSPVLSQPLLSESVASSHVDGTSLDTAEPETEDLQGRRPHPWARSGGGLLAASAPDTAQQPSEEQSKSLEKPKQKKNRCFMCRKKVGLTGFECRCGNVYCGVHRYSDVHSCPYNYRADAAERIRKENPVVVGEKIQKI